MKLKTSLGLALALACSLVSAATPVAPAQSALSEQSTPRLVVKYRDNALAERAMAQSTTTSDREVASAKRARFAMQRIKVMASGAIVYHLGQEVSLAEAAAAAARIAQDPAVEYAAPDVRVRTLAAPSNDSFSNLQWPLMARSDAVGGSNFAGAWALTRGTGMLVGVIDTGSLVHSDLAGQTLAGYDFVSADSGGTTFNSAGDGDGRDYDPTDPGDFCAATGENSTWHGMKVASQIVALADNAQGIAGAAPRAKVLQIRALGRCGGFLSDVADALTWSVGGSVAGVATNTTPVQVVNLSLGAATGTACYAYFQSAVTAATSRNVPVVVAAGNDAKNDVGAPANCAGVITVAAHTRSGDLASYSNYSSAVTLTAPGGGTCAQQTTTCSTEATVSLGNNGVTTVGVETPGTYFAGTSAATPHVAAAVALIRSVAPNLTPAEIKGLLIATARSHPADSFCATTPNSCGAGMLDAAAAVQAAVTPVLSISHSYPGTFISGGQPTTLTASVTGGMGNTYTWTQIGGTTVAMSNADSAAMSFTTPAVGGTLTFRVNATTALGTNLSLTQTVVVNSAPTLTSKSFSVISGSPLSAKLVASDVDGDAVTFTLVDGPVGLTLQGDTLNWATGAMGDYAVTVAMTDARGATSQGSAVVTVTAGSGSGSVSGSSGGGGGSSSDLAFLALMAAGLAAFKRKKA